MLIVSSGAIGIGRRRIAHASHQNTSCQITYVQILVILQTSYLFIQMSFRSSDYYSSACAAAGQLGIMALYETMFTQYDITISQLLVTAFDFTSAQRRGNITSVIADLLACGVVPILNENDAVSANQGYKMFEGASFADNDSLASLVASQVSANLLILLTDVAGVYDRPPKEPGARVIDIYSESVGFKVGEKSAQGRGGMSAKVDAALTAINNGVEAVVIAAGNEADIVEKVLSGSRTGTLFLPESKDGSLALSGEAAESRMAQINNEKIEDMATSARAAGRVLQTLQADERSHILETIARLLREQQDQIFQANEIDVSLGESRYYCQTIPYFDLFIFAFHSGLNEQLLARLKLTPAKLDTLVAGILAIARDADPIDQVSLAK